MLTGVMGGADILAFIPLDLTAVERHPEFMKWADSWWGTGNTSWLCRVRPDWDVRVVPPTRGGRCGIGTTVWLPFKTPWRSRQSVHSPTYVDVKMGKEGFSSRNVHLHHSLRHCSVEKVTARTTNLHCLPSSFL
jgi:hypothetical protein